MAPIAARKPRAVVVGSLNLDEVFVVPHIAAEGETLSAAEYTVQAGGKGARTPRMEADGVRVGRVVVSENEHTGRAIIQLSASTRDNAIVLFPAANHRLSMSDVKDAVLGEAGQPGDWLVLQNEVRFSEEDGGPRAFHDLIKLAKEKGALPPLPCKMPVFAVLWSARRVPRMLTAPGLRRRAKKDDVSRIYPLESVDVLLLNAHEARGLAGEGWSGAQAATPVQLLATICTKIPSVRLVVMTLGAEGVVARWRSGSGEYEDTHLPAAKLLRPVVDTTGAGDTFAGYLIAGLMRTVDGDGSRPVNFQVDNALREAVVAAAMACETHGAMAGVPTFAEVSQRIIDLRDKK
ncbi:MAG: Ribokinase-like protein [Olpidium bornovanus]|uniref:Ribokinase-like protein n=1 Tax=Olpidium bornovanus TaxID=278681 RepID=A0A8H8DGG6_9FUNG|nr:MAG: Ribokinase-like protein [Olpidium bornovanus]